MAAPGSDLQHLSQRIQILADLLYCMTVEARVMDAIIRAGIQPQYNMCITQTVPETAMNCQTNTFPHAPGRMPPHLDGAIQEALRQQLQRQRLAALALELGVRDRVPLQLPASKGLAVKGALHASFPTPRQAEGAPWG